MADGHAAFPAGWGLAALPLPASMLTISRVYSYRGSNKIVFELGEFAFNERTRHGEPEFRAAMVRGGGYDAHALDVDKAFEKGKQKAGLT
jgi:hypothetical protein